MRKNLHSWARSVGVLQKDLKLVPRTAFLRQIQGVYTQVITPSIVSVDNLVATEESLEKERAIRLIWNCLEAVCAANDILLTATITEGKITIKKQGKSVVRCIYKMLSGLYPEQFVSIFANAVAKATATGNVSFEISCRYKDFARMSECSPKSTFHSCIRNSHRKFEWLKNRKVGLVLQRDKAGKIMWRCVCVHEQYNGKDCLILSRFYGAPNGNHAIDPKKVFADFPHPVFHSFLNERHKVSIVMSEQFVGNPYNEFSIVRPASQRSYYVATPINGLAQSLVDHSQM